MPEVSRGGRIRDGVAGGNATCATALIDRVIHHADVISIEGKSYRLREAEGAAAPKEKPKPKK